MVTAYNKARPATARERREMKEEPAEFEATEIHGTEKATLYELADTGQEKWFPNSVIIDFDGHTLLIANWFAKKEGLI